MSEGQQPQEQPPRPGFYFRYYAGHHGKFGHEFLELEVRDDGRLRYANNSRYRGDKAIKKEGRLSPPVVDELKRLIRASEIFLSDDAAWPSPDRNGRQELEILLGDQHISFATNKVSTMPEVQSTSDPEGLSRFVHLVQDVKLMLQTLIALHHRMQSI